MGRGPAETKRQMESIDSILDFVVGNGIGAIDGGGCGVKKKI